MTIAIAFMKMEMGALKTEGKIERVEIRRECANSIAEIRQELRACQSENDTLRKQNDTLRAENLILHRRFSALELRLKHYVK